MRLIIVVTVVSTGCFSGVWLDRWSSVCLRHLHHLPADQEHQAAHGSLHRWERHITQADDLWATTFSLVSYQWHGFFFSSLQMTEFKRSKDAGASLTIAAGEPRGVCADANERVDQKGRWRVKIAGHSLIKATAQCEQTRGLFQGGVWEETAAVACVFCFHQVGSPAWGVALKALHQPQHNTDWKGKNVHKRRSLVPSSSLSNTCLLIHTVNGLLEEAEPDRFKTFGTYSDIREETKTWLR